MKYRVHVLFRAERDLDEIVRWIRKRSPQGAATWMRRWDKVLDDLSQHAEKYGVAPEDADHDLEIRHIVFKTRRGLPYRALFTIRDSHVYIMHVRGPGQDLIRPDEIETAELP